MLRACATARSEPQMKYCDWRSIQKCGGIIRDIREYGYEWPSWIRAAKAFA